MTDTSETARGLTLDADRLLPGDPVERALARQLHEEVRDLPVISPHGHVDPSLFVHDMPFTDPTSLLITPDHYVTRLLHASGVPLATLGVRAADGADTDGAAAADGRAEALLDEATSRRAWRALCEHWEVFAGTPVRDWLVCQLVELFGVELRPSAATAEELYDQISQRLREPECRPRALFERFGVAAMATTDDPCSTLEAHRALADDPTWRGRIVPTFRPDRYLEPGRPAWAADVARLGEAAEVDTGSYEGYLAALEARRRYFVEHGATSADHSHDDVGSEPLDAAEAARIYDLALRGEATAAEATAFRRHLLCEMARMSCDDGLVMTLHPGVRRGHHRPTTLAHGPDTGHDIPTRIEFTDALRPLLERYGTHPNLHLVLFTVDESTWSRELAPLAGFYPSVYVGVPWWFLDAPESLRRFRAAVTPIAGFTRTSGFVDDSRALCSLRARHDLARRVDAGFLARLVAEHRLELDEALGLAVELVADQPRRVFKL